MWRKPLESEGAKTREISARTAENPCVFGPLPSASICSNHIKVLLYVAALFVHFSHILKHHGQRRRFRPRLASTAALISMVGFWLRELYSIEAMASRVYGTRIVEFGS